MLTKRFWAAADERGLVYHMFDEQGATHWQGRSEATGWLTLVGTPQAEMWIPFGLPGQIALGRTRISTSTGSAYQEGTEAHASGTGGTWTRGPLILNRWRTYDPVSGSFMSADPLDQEGRIDPEGYAYGRWAFADSFDPSGLATDWFHCNSDEFIRINIALTMALYDVLTCSSGECGFPGGESIRRVWQHALLNMGTIVCLGHGISEQEIDRAERWGFKVRPIDGLIFELNGDPMGYAASDYLVRRMYLTKFGNPKANCLVQIVAHEALHMANNDSSSELAVRQTPNRPSRQSLMEFLEKNLVPERWTDAHGETDAEERWVKKTVYDCVKCRWSDR